MPNRLSQPSFYSSLISLGIFNQQWKQNDKYHMYTGSFWNLIKQRSLSWIMQWYNLTKYSIKNVLLHVHGSTKFYSTSGWLLIYPMDGLQNVINIVEFPSLLHKQQLDLKNGYQQSLLSVDDLAGNMDVMTN